MSEEEKKPKPSARELERNRLSSAERVTQLRERLYARGSDTSASFVRHDVGQGEESGESTEVVPQTPPYQHPVDTLEATPEPVAAPTPVSSYANRPLPHEKKGMSFRGKILTLGFVFFLVTVGVAAAFYFFGNRPISGSNITVNVDGPLSVGGGDVMTTDVTIQNFNRVAIESATLVVTYPKGVQSIVDPGRELYTDRIQLSSIAPNEEVKIPIRMLIFGEENDEKELNISVEYRVRGSNATFKKDALPFDFKIGISPVIVNVNALKSIPTDQETTIELVIQSNTKEPLTDIIVRALYPQGFAFLGASPETTSGEDTWKIKSLKPGEEKKISIKGKVTGLENDENEFEFEVGVANGDNPFDIASSLAKRTHVMTIERPFLDVVVRINGSTAEPAIIDTSGAASVNIEFTNTLDTPVYDTVITTELSGNSLSEMDVRVTNGFYDSLTNTITWDSVDIPELRELAPGDTNMLSFTLDSSKSTRLTPEMKLKVNIAGNRVGEDRVPERVTGTVARSMRVSSVTKLTASALYSDGPFVNSGPVPPVAETPTTYTVLFTVKNGTNPVTGAEVTAQLPQYVKWLDTTSDDSAVHYADINRTIKWNIGELKANEYKEVWMQISFTPSLSQVGEVPRLVARQTLRATDRFTDKSVETHGLELSTMLSNDPNPAYRDGSVREP